jgi:hypothetical protein
MGHTSVDITHIVVSSHISQVSTALRNGHCTHADNYTERHIYTDAKWVTQVPHTATYALHYVTRNIALTQEIIAQGATYTHTDGNWVTHVTN